MDTRVKPAYDAGAFLDGDIGFEELDVSTA
jgi:hypothetical protein